MLILMVCTSIMQKVLTEAHNEIVEMTGMRKDTRQVRELSSRLWRGLIKFQEARDRDRLLVLTSGGAVLLIFFAFKSLPKDFWKNARKQARDGWEILKQSVYTKKSHEGEEGSDDDDASENHEVTWKSINEKRRKAFEDNNEFRMTNEQFEALKKCLDLPRTAKLDLEKIKRARELKSPFLRVNFAATNEELHFAKTINATYYSGKAVDTTYNVFEMKRKPFPEKGVFLFDANLDAITRKTDDQKSPDHTKLCKISLRDALVVSMMKLKYVTEGSSFYPDNILWALWRDPSHAKEHVDEKADDERSKVSSF
eukprot:762539-Hanusia_phi.AAC.6